MWKLTMRMIKLSINNVPIRYKLISLLLLISMLPTIGLGILSGWAVESIIEKQMIDHTLQLIGEVNKSTEVYVSHMQNLTYLISMNEEMEAFFDHKKGDGEADYKRRSFLQGLTSLYSEAAGILVVNDEGEMISNEMYKRTQTDLTKEPWYQAAVKNEGIFKMIGKPVNRNIRNHVHYREDEVVSAVRAVIDPETQRVKGVVLIDLKLRVLAEATKNIRLGKTGYLMIMDENGGDIYSPEASELFLPKQWFQQESSGDFSKRIKGEDYQLIYETSAFTNWTTVGVFKTGEPVFEVKEIHLYVLLFLLAAAFLGMTASYYLSYSMSRPILKLNSFMQKAESGDFSTLYQENRQDEIGLLGKSFNRLMLRIQELMSVTEKQERQKREAELRALQAQINPHFLYNTLDTINWMARKKGAEEVTDLVQALSKLFRISLSKGRDMIPLSAEFEHVENYLKIQKARYRDKLNYSLEVPEFAGERFILKLVLQPIVENAIYHGIKEKKGSGHIVIKGKEEDGCLMIKVEDDGAGMDEKTLKKITDQFKKRENTAGYGMINVHERIALTFGEQYGLTVESRKGAGTSVTIRLPILTKGGRALE
ncbi:HAMP domain-containing protein [Bacillus swezeyi]|uniref:histidine kinase n=2 Tax=Bacillus swezeyi TaxID=1925020 RepID=A0A5M8RLR4_9BACI|nr:sensor histidine kinase [Bacillus swezeyi]KAA6449545.1 sensor histidine kinase [Bacillus swezeyi]TYS33558.1 HAMP domain-containing protein [Bacillus swezeyi]